PGSTSRRENLAPAGRSESASCWPRRCSRRGAAPAAPPPYLSVSTESPTEYPTPAARLAAALSQPAASRPPAVAGHSRPCHPVPSRRLWPLRRGRWGRRFWGGQLTHPRDDAFSLKSLKLSLYQLLDIRPHVADGFR